MEKTNRNVILDVIRGLAGLAVPMMHLREGFGWTGEFCGHTYFAVEFYILLMAYMFGAAYDRRWAEGMSVMDFAKRRLKRMHILVVSSFALSMAVWGLQLAGVAWAGKSHMEGPAWMQAWWAAAALLMLPAAGNSLIAPLNACSWTLYYQYLGNILYAAGVRKFSKSALAAAALVSALAAVVFVFPVDLNALFGTSSAFLAEIAARKGDSIEIGWSLRPDHFYGACVRLFFPFLFGMFLARTGWKIRIPRWGLPICLGVFLLVLFTPMPFGGVYQNGAFELVALMVVFPFLLLVGAGTEVAHAKTAAVCAFFAELSYPFYMSHYPFMKIHNWWVRKYSAGCSAGFCLALGVCEYLALAGLAYVMMRYWDRPVRRAVTAVCRKKTNNQ